MAWYGMQSCFYFGIFCVCDFSAFAYRFVFGSIGNDDITIV